MPGFTYAHRQRRGNRCPMVSLRSSVWHDGKKMHEWRHTVHFCAFDWNDGEYAGCIRRRSCQLFPLINPTAIGEPLRLLCGITIYPREYGECSPVPLDALQKSAVYGALLRATSPFSKLIYVAPARCWIIPCHQQMVAETGACLHRDGSTRSRPTSCT